MFLVLIVIDESFYLVLVKQETSTTDKVKTRLEQLDDFEEVGK